MISTRTLLVWSAVVLSTAVFSAAQTRRRSEPKKPAENSTPWPYTKVIKGIEGITAGDWKEEEVIKDILRCKVDFAATDGVKADLRKHGASEHVIEAIVQVAPLPPPNPPNRIPTGSLSMRCAPAECEVVLNGRASGVTERGELNISKLPVGETVVDVTRKGYIAQQKTVQIAAHSQVSLAVTLDPDYTTKTEFGGKALQAMLNALGVGQDQKQLWTLAGSGSATSWDSDGKDSEWNIAFEFGPPNLLKMDARGSGGNLTLYCRGERCEQKKKASVFPGKRPKAPALDGLTTNLTQFARCHMAVVLSQLTGPSGHALAGTFNELEEHDQHFTVETSDISYDVTILPKSILSQIVWNPRSGLGAGLSATFGNYLKIAGFEYPSHTTVKLPGQGQHGIEIRFDSLRQESNLREKDFLK